MTTKELQIETPYGAVTVTSRELAMPVKHPKTGEAAYPTVSVWVHDDSQYIFATSMSVQDAPDEVSIWPKDLDTPLVAWLRESGHLHLGRTNG